MKGVEKIPADKFRAPFIQIRRATRADLAAVLSFDSTDEHMARAPVNATRRLAGRIEAGDAFLAFADDNPVGYARVDSLWPEMCPLLSWLFVVPAFRKTGLADQLRQFVFAEFKREGFTSLLRSACTDRPHMIQALRNAGLTECGLLRFETGGTEVFFWQPL